jgi:mono/diheme cytochrome c family protein/glucose/arabinose dehydrogenase
MNLPSRSLSLRIAAAAVLVVSSSLSAFAADPPAKAEESFPPMPPIQSLSPADSLKTMKLKPGYHMELVLSEPEIKEPSMIAFDGDGRMFVTEFRTYMQEIDGLNEFDPVSRVSLHWSSKHDGVYDKHTIFADKLVLPRMILPLGKGQLLISETNSSDIYLYTDTKGTGVADKKELWFEGGPRGGNLEHQPNGLLWSLDNWIYSTYNPYRLRWNPQGAPTKEPTAANGGQWGIGQDDHGKQWFVNAGGEKGPVNYQTPIVYGAFNTPDQYPADFPTVWPLVGIADVQGGIHRFRPEDKTLNHFTATSGSEIYRGDRLPADLKGDLIFGEPVGRLVRRAKVTEKDGVTTLANAYDKDEFIRSTDPLFRPINAATAPDGTLYFVDMYRGIIQEGNWVREGSYLRNVVKQYQLDKQTDRGRIYRLVYDGMKPGPQPSMYEETPAQLVAHLEHPNGWWRDTAQKLLVLSQDKSVVPALTEMARNNPNYLARLHALWTLEGLGAVTPELIREKLKDAHPQLRVAAIRVSETLYKNAQPKKPDGSLALDKQTPEERATTASLASQIQAMSKDPDADVAVQSMLTAKLLNLPDWKTSIAQLAAVSPFRGVKEFGFQILNPPAQIAGGKFTPDQMKLLKAGESTFQTLCATCHGLDGKGLPMAGAAPGAMLAPPLSGSKTIRGWRDGGIHVLLQGLIGDIDGKKYEGQMVTMASNDDAWIASVLSYVRNSFGNHSGIVTAKDVAKIRTATKARVQPWTIAELRATLPQTIPNRNEWKLTASHKPADCAKAVDGNPDSRYTTGVSQVPGMWFQIELRQETSIIGVELDSTKSANDYPRGYTVETSKDGQAWGKPVATGKGLGAVTEITFPAVNAKFIRITQTGSAPGNFWSIHELEVFTPKTEMAKAGK